jgi:Tfp pilus assembly protein PilN
MRAVNLIPSEQQRGAGGVAGKSNGGAHIVLGALAVLVALTALFVSSGKSVNDKKTQLADISAQATAAEAKASSLQSYTKFAALRQKRVETVTQLAATRFDWAHAFREVARVLPDNAWLSALTATTTPSVSLSGGGATGSLRGAIDAPAIVLQGCTTSQASVSKLLARLRLIDGVQRVSLEDSTLGAAPTNTGSGSSSSSGEATTGGDCRGGHAKFPIFNVDIWFDQTGTVASSTTTGATTTASATSAAPSSTATPASTGSPASTATPSTTTSGTTK